MDRREFIKKSIYTLSATAIGLSHPKLIEAKTEDAKVNANPIVALETSSKVRKAPGSYDEDFIIQMLDRGMKKITGAGKPDDAWKNLFSKDDVIGIKVNSITGKMFSSRLELVRSIVKILVRSGIEEKNIIIFDRKSDELIKAGYKINKSTKGVRCFGTIPDGGGYSDNFIVFGEIGSRPSRILESCSAIINVPLIRDHGIVGITCALKNYLGTIDNPHKYHMNHGDPFVADLNASCEIKIRNRLTICDGLTAQYHLGPGYEPDYSWEFNSILMSRDPVALDVTVLDIIEKKRKEKDIRSLEEVGRFPKYIFTASDEKHRVGISDRSKIKIL